MMNQLLISNNGLNVGHAPPVHDDILFYDERIDEDGFDYFLVEEFFLSSKRKALRISKDKTAVSNLVVAGNMNNFSRIDTDYDESNESDSSIQENVTYQALQNIRFPGSMK